MLSGIVRKLGDNRCSLRPTMAMYQRRYVQPSIIISSVQQNPKAAGRVPTLPQNGPVLSQKKKLTKGSQTAQSQTPNAINAESELKVKQLQKQSEDARLEALRSRLRAARVSKQPNIVEEVMREVRTNPVNLNAVDLSAGFEGCLAMSNLEMSTWVLSYMKSLRYMVPAEYIGLVVKRASSIDQLASLVALVKELTSTGTFKNSKQSIEEYLDTVLLAWTQNQRLKPELVHDGLQQTYDIYLNLRNEKKMNIKLSRETYTTLAMFHVRTRRGDQCLEIFQEMNRVNVEPDLESCEKVLEEAIAKMETKVVKLIVTLYMEVFNLPMEIKTAQDILKMAVKTSDGQLAILAFQLLTSTSITPDRMDYYHLLLALLRSNDIVSAVEALQDMEARNVSFIPSYHETRANRPSNGEARASGTSNAFDLHEKVKNELREILSKLVGSGKVARAAESTKGTPKLGNNTPSTSVSEASINNRRHDMVKDFYHALVGQVQTGQPVPRIVVDTTLEAYGQCKIHDMSSAKHLKRLRSMFDEYPTVFKLQHDITSYVALINAARHHASFPEMLTLFQQLDHFLAHDKKPSVKDTLAYNQYDFFMKEGLSVAYSTLFTFMADRSITQGFREIWRHMRTDAKVLPTTQCLLRLSKVAAANGNKGAFDAVVAATNEALHRALGGKDRKHPVQPTVLKDLAHGFDIGPPRGPQLQQTPHHHSKKRTHNSPIASNASDKKTSKSVDKGNHKDKRANHQKQKQKQQQQQPPQVPRSATPKATPQAARQSSQTPPQKQRL